MCAASAVVGPPHHYLQVSFSSLQCGVPTMMTRMGTTPQKLVRLATGICAYAASLLAAARRTAPWSERPQCTPVDLIHHFDSLPRQELKQVAFGDFFETTTTFKTR